MLNKGHVLLKLWLTFIAPFIHFTIMPYVQGAVLGYLANRHVPCPSGAYCYTLFPKYMKREPLTVFSVCLCVRMYVCMRERETTFSILRCIKGIKNSTVQ